VARGDADVAHGIAFDEAGALEQPCGGKLDLVVVSGPVRDFFFRDVECRCDAVEKAQINYRVFEEGAGAAAVRLAVDEQHTLGMTDLADGVIDLDRGRLSLGEVTREVGVGEVRGSRGVEAECDRGDDVAIAVRGVEDAAPVGKAALGVGEVDELHGFEIECADGVDGFRDLLAVGTDVLDGCSTEGAGDTGEAFDSADSLLADGENEVVPFDARGDGLVEEAVAVGGCQGLVDGEMDDEAGEAGVADEEVTAAAEDEDGEIAFAGEADGFD